MSTPAERAQAMLTMIVAASDAVRVLSGVNGAAATELAMLAVHEIQHVVSERRARASRARSQRRARKR